LALIEACRCGEKPETPESHGEAPVARDADQDDALLLVPRERLEGTVASDTFLEQSINEDFPFAPTRTSAPPLLNEVSSFSSSSPFLRRFLCFSSAQDMDQINATTAMLDNAITPVLILDGKFSRIGIGSPRRVPAAKCNASDHQSKRV
jgi:hypothetical protein